MAKKLNDIKVGEYIEFIFLGSEYIGEVLEINKKQNNIRVKTKQGIIHMVGLSSDDNKHTYLK
jgi:hypothetical protein